MIYSLSFGHLLARMATFVQTSTGQTDLTANKKLKYCVQSASDRAAPLIFIITWLRCQNSLITLDNLKNKIKNQTSKQKQKQEIPKHKPAKKFNGSYQSDLGKMLHRPHM